MEKLPQNSIKYRVYSILGNSSFSSLLHTTYHILHTDRKGFIKFTRRSIALILAIAVILPSLSYIFLFRASRSEAAWFDDSWSYRQRVDVTNSGSNQTDYQTLITLNTSTLISAGKMQSDCDDLRVTDVNGRLLKHWIEQGCNTTTTKIWTKVPSITTSGATVYLYYGNSSASDGGAIDQVFDTNNSLSYEFTTGNESFTFGNMGTPTVSNGILSATASSNDPQMVSPSGLSITASSTKYIFVKARMTNASVTDGFYWITNLSGSYDEAKHAGSSAITHNGSWQIIAINVGADADWANTVTQLRYDMNATNGSSIEIDWIRVHNSGSTTPSAASPTSEEKATAPVAYWKFDEGNGVVASNSQYKSSGTVTNLIVNPSIETNTTSWATLGTNTMVKSSEKAATGNSSIKMTYIDDLRGNYIGVSGLSTSTAYIYSIYVYIPSDYNGGIITLSEEGSFSDKTGVTAVNASLSTRDTWQRISYAFTTGADVSGNLLVRFASAPTSGKFIYTDSAQMETGSNPTNYCDGSLTGNGTRSWSGTAHASTSTCSNGTDGMISSAAWQNEDQCISGKCLKFDGTNSHLTTYPGTSSPLNITGNFSVSLWLKTSNTSASVISFFDQSGGSGGYGIAIGQGGAAAGKVATWTTAAWVGGNTTINDNRWHHVVVSSSGATITIYVDGVSDGSGSSSGATTWSGARKIGVASTANTEYFKGHLDEVKIYNFALSAAQIKANYVAKTGGDSGNVLGAQDNSPLSNGLVGYWKMDEAAANTCTGGVNDSCDSSGNGKDASWTSVNGGVAGKFGNATSYDGSSSVANAGANSDYVYTSGQKWTVATWFKTSTAITGANGGRAIISKGTGSLIPGYAVIIGQLNSSGFDNKIGFVIDNSSGNNYGNSTSSLPTVNDGVWHHVAIVFDATTTNVSGTIFLDGTQYGSQINSPVASSGWSATSSQTLKFGSVPGAEFFTGSIDEARVYNRALSPSDISQLYNFAPGPAYYYKLDDGSGTTGVDSSGNNYAATFTSPTWTTGKYGKAVNFNGTSTYATHSNSGLNLGARTISAWVKPNFNGADATGHTIWESGGGCCSANQVMMFKYTSGHFYWRVVAPDGVTIQDVVLSPAESATHIVSGRWMHIAGTYEASGMKLYINGVLVGSRGAITIPTAITSTTYIGTGGYGAWNGVIDDFKIYNYARSAKQIIEDMNSGHPAPGSPVGSPLGWWKFDEGTDNTCTSGGSTDACNSGNSGSTLHGTNTSTTWTQSGKIGKALSFNGITPSKVDMGNPIALQFNNDFTLSSWVNVTNIDPTFRRGIISKFYNTAGNRGYRMGIEQSTGRVSVQLSVDGTNSVEQTSTTAVSAGTWTHIAAVYRASAGAVDFYINGKLDVTRTGYPTSIYNTSQNFEIGTWDVATANHSFVGTLDEVKVYNSSLTADQIKFDMNQGAAQVLGATGTTSAGVSDSSAAREYCVPGDSSTCNAPVGEWKFDEGSGTTINDKSGNGSTGTMQGTTTNIWTTGKVGKAGNFNGTDNGVSIPYSSTLAFSSGTYTFEAWIYPTATPNVSYLLSDGAQQFRFMVQTASTVQFPSSAQTITISPTIQNNTWQHIVATYDGTTAIVYINGIRAGSNAASYPAADTGSRFIGSGPNATRYFSGKIDDFKIYNYVRTPAQVAWDFNKGAPSGWWKFDECQGTTAYDDSRNGNGATNGINATISIGGSGGNTTIGTCSTSGAWADGATGKRNASIELDGTDDGVSLNPSTKLNTTTGSVAVWVKPSSTQPSTNHYIFSHSAGASGRIYLNSNSTGTLLWARLADGTTIASVTVTANEWHHAVLTWNGTTAAFYVDGTNRTTTASFPGLSDIGSSAALGRFFTDGSQLFAGQIDDFRTYQFALTANQIKTLYSGGVVNYQPSQGQP